MTVSALDVQIETIGDLPGGLLVELVGFDASEASGGVLLRGTVADAAALWGVLHRLHRAGLGLRSVRRAARPSSPSGAPAGRTVRVEVDGYAAAVVGAVPGCLELFHTAPSTTLVLAISGDDDLFEALDALEDLALEVRRIEVG